MEETKNKAAPVIRLQDVRKEYVVGDSHIHALDGVSLTVCDSKESSFRVAIIPYTFEHTNFCRIGVGSVVNLEFDIVGKYIARLMQNYTK